MKTQKEHVIYLAGQISDKAVETYKWRKRFIKEFKYNLETIEYRKWYTNITIIDPCDTEFGKAQDKSNYNKVGRQAFPALDYDSVKRSTIIVFNIHQYDQSIPLIGTFFEMSWAFTMADVIKIGIFDSAKFCMESDYYIHHHPFVEQTMTLWVNDEIEAANIVKNFCGV